MAPARTTRSQWGAALLLVAFFAGRLLHVAALKSPSYDEALYLVYGHSLWETGDFRLSIDKPPLVPWVAGLPALLLGASFDRGDEDWVKADLWLKADSPWNGLQDHRWRFFLKDLHHNKVPARRLLFWSRAALILLDAGALLGLFALAAVLFGATPALWLIFLCTMCPNLLAYAGLVGEDATVALFYALAALAFMWALEAPSPRRGALFGALTAAALLSKHSALTLGPGYIGLLMLAFALGVIPRERAALKRLAAALGAATAALAGVVLAAYLFVDIRFYPLSIKNTLLYQTRGQAAYCLGLISNRGFWYYYLVCLALKLSPALLILPVVHLWRRTWTRREVFLAAGPLVCATVLVAVASANRIQIGLRYVLPAVPLLAVLAALAAARRPWLGAALGLWQVGASLAIHPHYLTYFNALAGGPEEGWRRLSDANADWGQDLRLLGDYVRRSGADSVILSYYGATVPEAVEFPFQDLYSFGIWGDKSRLGAAAPKKELLAVSATNRIGLYLHRVTGPDPFAWLGGRKPEAFLGNSIFVYDITADAEAHAHLARLYLAGGFLPQADRETRRAKQLGQAGP